MKNIQINIFLKEKKKPKTFSFSGISCRIEKTYKCPLRPLPQEKMESDKVDNMNEKALKTLEYYKITEQLESFATSSLGKDMCRRLMPSAELA